MDVTSPLASSDTKLGRLSRAFELVTRSYSRAIECLRQLGKERDAGKRSHASRASAHTLATVREGGRSRAGLTPSQLPACSPH